MPSAAEPATYTLHAETGHIDLGSADLGDVDPWLRHVLDLTRQAAPHLAVVGELRQRIENGLAVLRDGDSTSETARAAAEKAIVAALAIGFHHTGGPAVALRIEAEIKARQNDKRVAKLVKGRQRPQSIDSIVQDEFENYIARHPDRSPNVSQITRDIQKSAIARILACDELPTKVRDDYDARKPDRLKKGKAEKDRRPKPERITERLRGVLRDVLKDIGAWTNCRSSN